MERSRVSRLELIDSRHSEAIELFKSNVSRFNSFKHLGSNESIQVASINEEEESFNSLEDLVAKKEESIGNLWETWNIAHRTVLTALKEKDTVMQKIVKEKDALAGLKITILEEKIALKDKQIDEMKEKLEEKQKITKEEPNDEPKCSTPIKGIHKRDFDLKRKISTDVTSRIIGLKSSTQNEHVSMHSDQKKGLKKSRDNDETMNAFKHNNKFVSRSLDNLTVTINKTSFQVDEEDFGIMEDKPIYQIQEESMMEDDSVFEADTGHINDAFDDHHEEFESEPVYENIRPGRLSSISSILPRNDDKENHFFGRFSKENQFSGRFSNISSIPYRHSGRLFNNSSVLKRNTFKENGNAERLSSISLISHRNEGKENKVNGKSQNIKTDKDNEVFRCRMDRDCNYSGSRIENHIATVHREHLEEIMDMANESKICI